MREVAACPCCESDRLRTIAVSEYGLQPPPPTGHAGRDWTNRTQRVFVFEYWHRDADRFDLRELLCETCGFVCYSPRPTAQDIERKYEVLRDAGEALGHADPPGAADAIRSMQLRDRLARTVPLAGANVLDIGGGDGRLMTALMDAGASCSVVDYALEPVPGVTRRADTIADLEPEAHFDVAVLSHVLEHVADPGGLLREVAAIAEHAYVEVPAELWRGTPIALDPVSHVNYFTETSLRSTAQLAGWELLRSGTTFSTYRGVPIEIVWIVARHGGAGAPEFDPRESMRRLEPSLPRRVRRRLPARAAGARAGGPRGRTRADARTRP